MAAKPGGSWTRDSILRRTPALPHLLLISVVAFKIGKGQDVQSGFGSLGDDAIVLTTPPRREIDSENPPGCAAQFLADGVAAPHPRAPPGPLCPGCGKQGHAKDKFWELHPELAPPKNKKRVRGVGQRKFHKRAV